VHFGGLIPGKPGYRNRLNRTGYDPIDTIAECGYMFGLFLRNLFKTNLRAITPVYLVLIGIAGIYFLGPIIFVFGNCGSKNIFCFAINLVLFMPYFSIGGMLIKNFIHNLINRKFHCDNSSERNLPGIKLELTLVPLMILLWQTRLVQYFNA